MYAIRSYYELEYGEGPVSGVTIELYVWDGEEYDFLDDGVTNATGWVCFTGLMLGEDVKKKEEQLEIYIPPGPRLGAKVIDRITSYNVCYTKLLRVFLTQPEIEQVTPLLHIIDLGYKPKLRIMIP